MRGHLDIKHRSRLERLTRGLDLLSEHCRRTTRQALSFALLALALGLGGYSCSQSTDEPLRVGLLSWPAYELPHIAMERGWLDEEQVRLIEYYSPADQQMAYVAGSMDAIAVTVDYALQMASLDASQRIVMVIDESHGGDALLADPAIGSLAELKGRSIGIERSALGAYMLKRALDFAGLARSDVYIGYVDIPETVMAFEQRTFDAVITYEPFRTMIRERGGVELFSSRQIPGEIIDVLVTREKVLAERGEQVRQLVDGWFRAGEAFATDPQRWAPMLAARENVTTEQFLSAMGELRITSRQESRRLLEGPSPGMLPILQRHAEIMRSEGLITSLPELETLIDGRWQDPAGQ